MADRDIGKENNNSISIDALPMGALQSIYHLITGKVENLKNVKTGNVEISSSDIDNLYNMIKNQMEAYSIPLDPVVTIKVTMQNHNVITYSSWEKYKTIFLNSNKEITSEIILTIEFLLDLPNSVAPQRFF